MSANRDSIRFGARFLVLSALAVFVVGTALAQPGGGRGRGGGLFNATGEAQVPPAVQMPRPSQDELARARELLADFRGGLAGEDSALLERYPRLLEVSMPVNTAIVPNLAQFFRDKHQQNLEVARAGDIDLLLMGDSITDFWRNEEGQFAGKAVLDEYFGQWNIANFGIAGDTTQGVLYRLQNGEGTGFSPRAVRLMIGTNNTGRNTAPEIAEGVGAVVLELRNRFPEAEILLLGIFPRGRAGDPVRATLAEINAKISQLDDGETVHYLDIGDVFLDADGNIPTSVMSDALHPSTEGYRLWAEAVQAPLTELMAP
jgi:lysophospholipase L1-like esterase